MNNPRRIQRHLVKALAAGALLAAAALPLAFATAASAATTPTITSVAFTPHGATANSFGNGASGTVTITGTGFAADGGTASVVPGAGSGTTFSSVDETSSTTVTADFVSAGTATPGVFSLQVNDDNGTGAVLASGFTIDAAPTITTITPDSIWESTGPTTVTITGNGFSATPTVTFTSDVNGTSLTSSVTSSTSTSIVLSVTPTNPVNSAPATAGTFDVTVTNTDGGTTTNSAAFTVGSGLENVSPSAETAIGTDTIALLGSGFEYGASLSFSTYSTPGVAGGTYTPDAADCIADVTTTTNTYGIADSVATTITSPTAGTAVIPIVAIAGVTCPLTITNTGAGNNQIGYTLDGAFGIDQASTVAPVITSVSPTTALTVGAAAVTETLTGSGFSSESTLGANPLDVAYTAGNGAGGTTFTFNAAATTGVTAGAFPVSVVNTNAGGTASYTPAITVAGPAIISQAPNLVVGAAIGTTVTLTGTGFTNTTSGTASGAGLTGNVSYLSATTLSLVLTAKPTGTAGGVVNVSTVTATGTVKAAQFSLTIDAAPQVTGPVTYATGAPSDVGVGATATTVYINGQGFLPGATVTAFTNGAGVADPNVTATVTNVNAAGTQITATVAVKAPDTNAAVGYTVTNTDGGSVPVAAFAEPIFIGAGPTITSVTPVTGDAGATTTFALAGTGFETGAVVTLSPANGTCGTPTISATTTLSVACTLGTAGVTPTYIVVTNLDGGSATSTTAVLGAQAVAKPFHVGAVHGAATVGKTVTILISGTGFYGQPKVTATGFKFGVKKDSGTVLTIRVTTKATVKAGEHELTVKLANGKSGKAGFDVKK